MNNKAVQVLIVEDDPGHAELIQHAFTSRGGQVRLAIARTLKEARARVADRIPDLMITDMHLPDGAGIELLPLDRKSVV